MNWTPFVPDDIRATTGALCYRLGQPELWWPKGEADYQPGGTVELAKETCSHCPVSDACLQIAMRAEIGDRGEPLGHWGRSGIWGGLSPRERANLAKVNPDAA